MAADSSCNGRFMEHEKIEEGIWFVMFLYRIVGLKVKILGPPANISKGMILWQISLKSDWNSSWTRIRPCITDIVNVGISLLNQTKRY